MAGKLDEEYVISEFTYGDDNIDETAPSEPCQLHGENIEESNKTKIIEDGFGIFRDAGGGDSKIVHRFTLKNQNDITVQIITYGATIISVRTPDKNHHFDDIVMGFDNFEGYTDPRNPYFGSTIGRITGVIPGHMFSIYNDRFLVTNNYMEDHHANGGIIGFDKVIWNANISNNKLCLSYMSRNFEEGFPGDVIINRLYELTAEDQLIIETSATCTKSTPVDVSSHVDWNLSSHLGGPKELYKHYLMVNADKYAQVNRTLRIISGKLKRVSHTVFDLRIPRPLGKIIHRVPGGGYDHYMHLIRGPDKEGVTLAAKITHPISGRFVEVYSDQPGVYVYTQNGLYAEHHINESHPFNCWCHDPLLIMEQKRIQNPLDMDIFPKRFGRSCRKYKTYGPLPGKSGANYRKHGGVRIVPANYPEPVTRYNNLDTFLIRPGQTYKNTTIYKFGNVFGAEYDPLKGCPLDFLKQCM